MDWISGIQRALDYVEEHLTEEIDYREAARQACSSSFHFQRMFAMLCGFSLGDYTRMRRLTLAAQELRQHGPKVIDTALKYGYDSPESFSRAFARFHGVSPSEARRGATVKSFSRLSVKLILTGGRTMDYRIEKRDAFRVLCRRKQVAKPQGDTATEEISKFWSQCSGDGTIEKLCACADFSKLGGLLGICFSGEMDDSAFPYGIGVPYNGAPITGEGLELVEIPAYTYAVFPCRGPMPEAFRRTYTQIVTEFFPQSNYEYGNGAELELYPSADTGNPDYYCEIWIAVKQKAR